MRVAGPTLAVVLLGLTFAPIVHAQNLPSDVEERLGIPPNALSDDSGGRRYRPLPSDVEQQLGLRNGAVPSDVEQRMQRQAYGDYGYDSHGDRRGRRYGHQRVAECQTRYEERFDPYRGTYMARPVRVCHGGGGSGYKFGYR